MATAPHIVGYAIVSEDGMLANAQRVMPPSLRFEADKRFFEDGLNAVDVVVHGRHSHEQQENSRLRHRLILTRRIPALQVHPSEARALLWNPAGASFEQALGQLGAPGNKVAVVGGPDVFGLFLDRYDIFHLSRAPHVRLPGGRPVFPEVPARTPEEVLATHGYVPSPTVVLDAEKNVRVTSWHPLAKPGQLGDAQQ